MADVFQWTMSAVNHKSVVDALVHEIREAVRNQTDLPIEAIFDLLPLDSSNAQEVISKGDGKFHISGNQFTNTSVDEVTAQLYDPVLRDHSMTLPAIFGGAIDDGPDGLAILFQPPLEMEVPRLAELGVERSVFQWVVSITVSDEVSLTVLHDQTSEDLLTWIEAELTEQRTKETAVPASVTDIAAFREGGACGGDPDDPNWYVYQRRDRLCITHYGTMAVGGSLAYRLKAGPATKAICDQFISQNCNPTCP